MSEGENRDRRRRVRPGITAARWGAVFDAPDADLPDRDQPPAGDPREPFDPLYERDFEAWTQAQAAALRQAAEAHPEAVAALDVPHLAEEIESLGRQAVREVYDRLVALFETEIILSAAARAVWAGHTRIDLGGTTCDAPVTPLRRRLWRERADALQTDVVIWVEGMASLTEPLRFTALIEKAWRDARTRAHHIPIQVIADQVSAAAPEACPKPAIERLLRRVSEREG